MIAPTATIETPTAGQYVTALNISGTAVDNSNGSGVSNVTFTLYSVSRNLRWNGSAWVTGSPVLATNLTGNNWSSAVALPSGSNLTAGSYQIYATPVDKVGNQGVTVTRSFNVSQ
jgi:hypothetical protein